MSLKLEVTIPVDSIDWLQTKNFEEDILFGRSATVEEQSAARNVCRMVKDGLIKLPYKVVANVAKKEHVASEPFRVLPSMASYTLPEAFPPLEGQNNEEPDKNDEYDKISEDECDVQSTMKKQSTRDEYDDDSEDYDKESEQADEDGDGTSCEYPYRSLKRFDVIVEMDGTGISFRISVGPYDGWNDLADHLQRVTILPTKGVVFFYGGTAYAQGHCGMMMKKAGVEKFSVIRVLEKDSRWPLGSDGELPSYTRVYPPSPKPGPHPMWSCPIPPFREQEGITIVFRDLTNHSLSIRACSATSLFSLAVAYETLTDRPRGLLTFKMPNGATYTVQSPGMGLQIRDLGLRSESVILVGPRV